jgi:hypothetical protein
MIAANEFILAYNGFFKEVHRRYGKEGVDQFWEFFKESYCQKLDDYIKRDGLKGMYDYWTEVLHAEGGRYHLTLREDEFVIDMHFCPSVGKVTNTHVEAYENYCGHCPTIYNPVIRKYGFEVDYYILDRNKGECRLHVRKGGLL